MSTITIARDLREEGTFEGYRIASEQANEYHRRFIIFRPNGSRLGIAWSVPGYKRMVRKDAGTNACDCGDIPSRHLTWREPIPGTNEYRVRAKCIVEGCGCAKTPAQARACRAPERRRK
jgi:hypothetical protein